jgi:ribosomal protein L19
MKRTNYRTLISMLFLTVASLGLTLLATAPASAQTPKFKTGDHVEVDANMTSWTWPDNKQQWMPATVIEIDQRPGYRPAYMVRIDATEETRRIPITPNPAEKVWIRPGGAQNGNNIAANNGGGNNGGRNNDVGPVNGGGEQPGNNDAGGAQFKVGDRVEVDELHISTSSPSSMQSWKKGTVTAVDRRPGYRPGYVVQVDPEPGQLPQTQWGPITRNSTERIWIRATGGTTPKIETNKLHVDQNNTVLADREPLDCSNFKQPAARNGSALPVDLAKKLVRCALGENPSPQGGEGASTVDISTFQVGAPRRWNLRIDTGAGGTPETIVYPVRAKYSMKTFHVEQNIVVTDREQMFACSVQIGEWVCGPDQVLKEGQQTRIQVKR